MQKVLDALKDGKFWDSALRNTRYPMNQLKNSGRKPDTFERHRNNKYLRVLFTQFYKSLSNLWGEMSLLTGKNTIVTKMAKKYAEGCLKSSCYIGMMFKSILYRFRSHGVAYVWEAKFIPIKSSGPLTLSDIFVDFDVPNAPGKTGTGTSSTAKIKPDKEKESNNIVTVTVKKRKGSQTSSRDGGTFSKKARADTAVGNGAAARKYSTSSRRSGHGYDADAGSDDNEETVEMKEFIELKAEVSRISDAVKRAIGKLDKLQEIVGRLLQREA